MICQGRKNGKTWDTNKDNEVARKMSVIKIWTVRRSKGHWEREGKNYVKKYMKKVTKKSEAIRRRKKERDTE